MHGIGEEQPPVEILEGAQQENPFVPEIPAEQAPEQTEAQITSDDLDIKLEEFFEDTFKES